MKTISAENRTIDLEYGFTSEEVDILASFPKKEGSYRESRVELIAFLSSLPRGSIRNNADLPFKYANISNVRAKYLLDAIELRRVRLSADSGRNAD